MNHRLLRSALLALGLCLAAPAFTLAQTLPAGVAQKSELSSTDTTQLGQWLGVHVPKLSSDDPREIKIARDAILLPLRIGLATGGGGVSVSFRVAMQKELARSLPALAEDKRELVAVNALRIMGEIGHASLAPTLSGSLKDPRPGVCYAGLYSIRAMFDAGKTAPAITGATVSQLLGDLKALGRTTTDPRVLDGIILALDAAAAIPESAISNARDDSMETLAAIVQAQSKLIGASDKPDEMTAGMLRAATMAQSALTTRVGQVLPAKLYRELVGISGDLIALTARLKARSLGDPESMATLLRSAESLLFLAADGLNIKVEQLKLADKLAANDTAAFDRGVGSLIGPGGRLTTEPFNFSTDRFKISQ